MGEWKVREGTVCTYPPSLSGSPLSALPGLWGYKTCPNWIQDPTSCSSQEVHRSQFLRLAWPGCNFRSRMDWAATGLHGMGDCGGQRGRGRQMLIMDGWVGLKEPGRRQSHLSPSLA